MHELSRDELERIGRKLADIARMIGPGSGYRLLFDDLDAEFGIRLPLGQLLASVPVGWIREVPSPDCASQPVEIVVDHLFEQVERRRITVSLGRLADALPGRYLEYLPPEAARQRVELPFEAVQQVLIDHIGSH